MPGESLANEIKKKGPFDSLEQEVLLNLFRTEDQLRLPFARLFEKHGLTSPQYNVLRILRGNGGEGLPCLEIGAHMLTRMPDMTRLVDRLEQSGWVERKRAASDRRVVLVAINPKGLEVLEKLDEPVRALHRQVLAHMHPSELVELNRLLVKARHAPDGAS